MTDAAPEPDRPHRRWRPWARLVGGVVLLLAGGGGGVYFWIRSGTQVLVAPAGPTYPWSTPADRPDDGRLRVLFLGNSFTQFNGGIALSLRELAKSAHKAPMPVFDQVTKFGADWAELWSESPALDYIHQGAWDYVVLQDYSRAALIYRPEMDRYGQLLAKEVRAAGAKPLYFMTWARVDEPQTQRTIAGTYAAVAAANRATVVPVGTAWAASLRDRPRLTLHIADKKHPTPAGTYLSACVFYAVLYHESPHGLTSVVRDGTTVYVGLSRADATYLQDVAWATVRQVGQRASTRPVTRPATAPGNPPVTRPASPY